MKYCKDCKYYSPKNTSLLKSLFKRIEYSPYDKCKRIIEDPIIGKSEANDFPDIERSNIYNNDPNKCGEIAKFFEPKSIY